MDEHCIDQPERDALDADPEVQREGRGHVENDEPTYPEQSIDSGGQNGPSYEANQISRGKEVRPGGSVNPHGNLSHADSED